MDSVHVNFFRRDGRIQYTLARQIPGNGLLVYAAPRSFLGDWDSDNGLGGLIDAGAITIDSKEHFSDGDSALGYSEFYTIHRMFESVGREVIVD
jgi:hypothetical protein